MIEWKPTLGKWNDNENYDIQIPIWRRMLNSISKYEDSKDVQKILILLESWNLTGDEIRMYVIGYVINKKGLNLSEFISEEMIQKIQDCSIHSKNIKQYTKKILKECHVSNAVIDEIKFDN